MEGSTKNHVKLVIKAQRKLKNILKNEFFDIEEFLTIYSSSTAESTIVAKNEEEKTYKLELINKVIRIFESGNFQRRIPSYLTKEEIQVFSKYIQGIMVSYLYTIRNYKDYNEIFETVKLGFYILNKIEELSKEIILNVFNDDLVNQGILLYLDQSMIENQTLMNILFILNTFICKMDPLSRGPDQGHYFFKVCAALTRFCHEKCDQNIFKVCFLSVILRICAFSSIQVMREILQSFLSKEIIRLILELPCESVADDFRLFLNCVQSNLPSIFLRTFLHQLFNNQTNYQFMLEIANEHNLEKWKQQKKEIITMFLIQHEDWVRDRIWKKYDKFVNEQLEEYLNEILQGYPVGKYEYDSDYGEEQKRMGALKIPQITNQQQEFARKLQQTASKYFIEKNGQNASVKPQSLVRNQVSNEKQEKREKILKKVQEQVIKLKKKEKTSNKGEQRRSQQEKEEHKTGEKYTNRHEANREESNSQLATNESPQDKQKLAKIIVIQEQNPKFKEQNKEQISNLDEVRQIIQRKLKEKKQREGKKFKQYIVIDE